MPKFGSARYGGSAMTHTSTNFTGSGRLGMRTGGGNKPKSVNSKKPSSFKKPSSIKKPANSSEK